MARTGFGETKNNYRVNPGELKEKVIIQKFTGTTTNENGFDEENWIDYLTIKASVNNLYGSEFWSAKEVNAENTAQFVTRYSAELTTINTKDYRIFWNEKPYNIMFIDNVKYKNRWIKILGIEIH